MRERRWTNKPSFVFLSCLSWEKSCGACLCFQDECANNQKRFQCGNWLPPLRRSNCQSFPKPLWADQKRFDGKEYQALQERAWERRKPSCRKGWKWEIHLFGYVILIISVDLFSYVVFRNIFYYELAFLCIKLWAPEVLEH